MNEFARRMANGASSAAMGGTTGAGIGGAVVAGVGAVGGSFFGPVGTFFGGRRSRRRCYRLDHRLYRRLCR